MVASLESKRQLLECLLILALLWPLALVNPLYELGYQVEFDRELIRQRPRGYRWILGLQPWTEMSTAAIHSFRYLQPSQSAYLEPSAPPVELLSVEEGRSRRIVLEPLVFDPADYDELICLVEPSK